MSVWFLISVLGLIVAFFLHFKSVEHLKLQDKYGKLRGEKRGKVYGTISGTLESIFLVGVWISPQGRFVIPFFSELTVSFLKFSVPTVHLIILFPLVGVGTWLGLAGVRQTGMEVAESHCTPKSLETNGVYSLVRHPQYLGWILAHVGLTFFFSAGYSLMFTPVLVVLIYLVSKKEEEELIREFGNKYRKYQRRVPMFIPEF
ncbi:MAG: methyltransferase family protein [Thermoproteota archaeon]